MRVVIVTGIYPPMIGGAGAVMHSLANCAPNEIAVVTGEHDSDGIRMCSNEEGLPKQENVYRLRRLSHKLNWLPRGRFQGICQAVYDRLVLHPQATRDLIRVLESLRPDVVCIGTLPTCYWVVSAVQKWRRDIKFCVYVHGEEVPLGAGFFNKIRQRALQRATALVAVSSFTKDSLISIGVPDDRITVITNGVDTARFNPGEKSPSIIERYGLANHRVLMTLARLDKRKGQDMLIQALPKIRASVPDVVYLVVGEGRYGGALRRLTAELDLEDAVIFAGAVTDEEVVDFYRTCDVYAMPNRTLEDGDTEGFGLVFLEAGACGKAVIGGTAGGVPDAVIHEKTGLLVDGTSTEAIADSCIRLLRDTRLRNELGSNGLIHARNNDWRMKTDQFQTLCHAVIGQ